MWHYFNASLLLALLLNQTTPSYISHLLCLTQMKRVCDNTEKKEEEIIKKLEEGAKDKFVAMVMVDNERMGRGTEKTKIEIFKRSQKNDVDVLDQLEKKEPQAIEEIFTVFSNNP